MRPCCLKAYQVRDLDNVCKSCMAIFCNQELNSGGYSDKGDRDYETWKKIVKWVEKG